MTAGGGENGRAKGTIVYCVVPRDLAGKLHEPLRRHFRDDPAVEVIVERRAGERRVEADRRDPGGGPSPEGVDRRRIRHPAGRRAGERRTSLLVPAHELPRKARAHADRLVFVEQVRPDSQHAEDVDTQRLVALVQAGDNAIFGDLYLRYFDRVFSYLRLLFDGAAEAEDATQEVFLKAMEALPRFDSARGPFRGWLFIIARNHALNELARSGRAEPADVEQVLRSAPAEDETGLRALEWITERDLHLFIERLPLAQRQVLFLRYVVGLSTEEVAQVLGQAPATIRKQHGRALAFLRDRLTAVGRDPRRTSRAGSKIVFRKAYVLRSRRFSLTAPN